MFLAFEHSVRQEPHDGAPAGTRVHAPEWFAIFLHIFWHSVGQERHDTASLQVPEFDCSKVCGHSADWAQSGKKLIETHDAASLQVPKSMLQELKDSISNLILPSSQSSMPAIYGMAAAAEVRRLQPMSSSSSQAEVRLCSAVCLGQVFCSSGVPKLQPAMVLK